MAKANGEFKEIVILFLIAIFLWDCVYGNTVVSIGHDIFTKVGISQQIERYEAQRGYYKNDKNSQSWILVGIMVITLLMVLSTGSYNNGNNRLDINKLKYDIQETLRNPSIFE